MKKIIPFIEWRKLTFIFSLSVFFVAILVLSFRGGFDYGIDFIGGSQVYVNLNEEYFLDDFNKLFDYSDIIVDKVGVSGKEYIIKIKSVSRISDYYKNFIDRLIDENILSVVKNFYPSFDLKKTEYGDELVLFFSLSDSQVNLDYFKNIKNVNVNKNEEFGYEIRLGFADFMVRNIIINPLKAKFSKLEILDNTIYEPIQGKQIRKQSILVSLVVLVLILFYIALRFQFRFAVIAVITLLHDVLFVFSCILFFNVEFDVSVVIALLTIIGYSLNDTIVIFDRIRENQNAVINSDFNLLINKSISQSFSRTIVTSITTLFVILSVLIFGGLNLWNLSITLFFGIIIGTYSSIFIASPLLFIWEKYFPSEKLIQKINSEKKDRILV